MESQGAQSVVRKIVTALALATAYAVAARLAMLLPAAQGQTSLIQPASGIAVASLMCWGRRYAGSVFLGALLAGLPTIDVSAWAWASAGGATVQALVAATLVRKAVGRPTPLSQEGHILRFLLLAGPVSCVIAPTCSLLLPPMLAAPPIADPMFTWFNGWVGDTIGVLVFAPLVLIGFARPRDLWRRRWKTVGVPSVVALAGVMVVFIYLHNNNQDQPAQPTEAAGWGLIGGLLFTCLLESFLLIQTGHRAAIEQLVRRRTNQLARSKADLESELKRREHAERELASAEHAYRQMLDALPDMVLVKGLGSNIVWANKAFCDYCGLTVWELMGTTTEAFRDEPEYEQRVLEQDAQVFATGEAVDIPAEPALRYDGQMRLFHTIKAPIRDTDGRVILSVGLSRDVTRQRRQEEQLRDANVQLEQRARELETLLYVASHDMREPLRAIRNFATLVNQRYTQRLDEQGEEFLERIAAGAERMDALIEDVLTLSRAQRMEDPDALINGRDIVDEALRSLRDRMEETGAVVRIADDLPPLRVNRLWAVQAIYNLTANSLKFTRPGEAPQIDITAWRGDDGETGLAVADRGPGVKPEQVERIFTLFQRGVGREIEGTGAGLAIVSQVAQQHGGRAWVRNRPDGGAQFIITFGQSEEHE